MSNTIANIKKVDWDYCELGEALTFQRGFDLPKQKRKSGRIPIVSSAGITDFHSNAAIDYPTLVTGRYGTIGELFLLREPCWPLNTTLFVNQFKKITPDFGYYLLQTIDFKSHSGKSGVPGVNRNDVHQEHVLIPTIKEQTAIANALSDVDALIVELEKLIAKKQAIKTASMQQLLTGRTRLPEFANHPDGTPKGYKQTELGEIPEDWGVTAVGEIGVFGRGRVISHTEINRSISNLYPVYSSQTSNDGIMGYLDRYDFNGEFITWTTDGVNAGRVFYRKGKFNCTNVCGVILVRDNSTKFVALAMNAEARKYVSTNLANPKLMNGEAKKVLIRKPKLVAEQTAIANILSDMDKVITATALDKTRKIKQGMMQELLTGKTRLI